MNLRNTLTSLVLGVTSTVGCGAGPTTRAADSATTLMAYTRATSDVVLTGRPVGGAAVKVQRIPETLLRDPARMLALRISWERQISSQVRDLPERRYRNHVRPLLVHALQVAGLSSVEVDGVLRGVDDDRSLQAHR
jgi:hypothetical protein